MKKTINLPEEVINFIQSNQEILLDRTAVIKAEKKNNRIYNYKEYELLTFLSYMVASITSSICKGRINQELITRVLKINKKKIYLYTMLSIQLGLIIRKTNGHKKSNSYSMSDLLIGMTNWTEWLENNSDTIKELLEDINNNKIYNNKIYNNNNNNNINNNYIIYGQHLENNTNNTLFDFPNISLHNSYLNEYNEIINNYTNKLESIPNKRSTKAIGLSTFIYVALPKAIEGIKNNNYNLSITKCNGRRESVTTTLKKELAKYILIDNEETISIDFISAQPTFFANKFKKEVDESFFKQTTTSIFYEELGKCMRDDAQKKYQHLNDKDLGKKLWQIIAYDQTLGYDNDGFESWSGKNKLHRLFYNYYPKTALLLDKLKKNTDNIANYITKLESDYVNNFCDLLTKNGISNIPNRDEVRFKKNDLNKVLTLLKTYKNEIIVNFKLGESL